MKKKIIILLALVAVVANLVGCGNMTVIDTTYTFDYAIIKTANGEIVEGEVKTWCDYEGEQIQITFKDGDTYLVSTINATLISYED